MMFQRVTLLCMLERIEAGTLSQFQF
ncbi:hypothetical protein Ahy_A06g026242 isoform B [Arachis hypogaea]|uniref:Uncharacterized protein n=1 Tax=Arachis hypogaea TaxID=3818 RepID=A0A445CJV1_ARAHY|nr:hypothetical protein Ahy_A06g026242 isoform B [Arachis hypogaea]